MTVDQLLSGLLYACGAVATIAAAATILSKILKKALTKSTIEVIHREMESSHEKMSLDFENTQSKLSEEMQKLNNKLDKYIDTQDEVNQVLKESLLASTRDRINQAHDYYTRKQFIGSHSLFVVEELYSSYTRLGGNSFIKRQMEDIRKLEVRSAETDNK